MKQSTYNDTFQCAVFSRYCDCFANGEFCSNCNCNNCSNNIEHEQERSKAIKVGDISFHFYTTNLRAHQADRLSNQRGLVASPIEFTVELLVFKMTSKTTPCCEPIARRRNFKNTLTWFFITASKIITNSWAKLKRNTFLFSVFIQW